LPGVGLDEAKQHPREGGLATTAFANDGERFATRDLETYAIDGSEARAI